MQLQSSPEPSAGFARKKVKDSQLGSIQGLRAVAALMVVLFHMNVHSLPNNLGAGSIWSGLNMGYAGVEIFFVLSGFIMFHIHSSDLGRPEKFLPYLSKRFTRIYPFFWTVILLVILLRIVSGNAPPSLSSTLIAATLAPMEEHYVLQVQWTLSFEILFYFIFGLVILHRKFGAAVAAIWFTSCAVVALTGKGPDFLSFFLSPYNLLFLFGILSAYIWPFVGRFSAVILLAGVILFFTVGFSESLGGYEYYKPLRTVLYGIGAAAIIASLVSLERSGRIRTPAALKFLGDASYSIYLCHVTAMAAAALVIKALKLSDLPLPVLAIMLFIAALVAGSFMHVVVERPIIAWVRRRLSPHSPKVKI